MPVIERDLGQYRCNASTGVRHGCVGNQERVDDEKGCPRGAFFCAGALKTSVVFQPGFNNWRRRALVGHTRPLCFPGKIFIDLFALLGRRFRHRKDIDIQPILVRRSKNLPVNCNCLCNARGAINRYISHDLQGFYFQCDM